MAGELEILLENSLGKNTINLKPHDTYIIPKNTWHKACNTGMGYCHVLEVQNGLQCVEEDIERKN